MPRCAQLSLNTMFKPQDKPRLCLHPENRARKKTAVEPPLLPRFHTLCITITEKQGPAAPALYDCCMCCLVTSSALNDEVSMVTFLAGVGPWASCSSGSRLSPFVTINLQLQFQVSCSINTLPRAWCVPWMGWTSEMGTLQPAGCPGQTEANQLSGPAQMGFTYPSVYGKVTLKLHALLHNKPQK